MLSLLLRELPEDLFSYRSGIKKQLEQQKNLDDYLKLKDKKVDWSSRSSRPFKRLLGACKIHEIDMKKKQARIWVDSQQWQ